MTDSTLDYKYQSTENDDPASHALAITPNDGVDLTEVPRAIYIGTAGNLVVDMHKTGTNITFSNVQAGTLLPLRVSRVYATGTSAGAIVALY